MKKYGLFIMGHKKPLYFDSIQERNKHISTIKGVYTYSTFSVTRYEPDKCPYCKKQMKFGEIDVDGNLEKIQQCEDCKYWEIIPGGS
jgi:hypothetical protein